MVIEVSILVMDLGGLGGFFSGFRLGFVVQIFERCYTRPEHVLQLDGENLQLAVFIPLQPQHPLVVLGEPDLQQI